MLDNAKTLICSPINGLLYWSKFKYWDANYAIQQPKTCYEFQLVNNVSVASLHDLFGDVPQYPGEYVTL